MTWCRLGTHSSIIMVRLSTFNDQNVLQGQAFGYDDRYSIRRLVRWCLLLVTKYQLVLTDVSVEGGGVSEYPHDDGGLSLSVISTTGGTNTCTVLSSHSGTNKLAQHHVPTLLSFRNKTIANKES